MASIDDGLVDSPFGRVRPEILSILNGGQAPVQAAPTAPQPQEAPVGLDAFRSVPQQQPTGASPIAPVAVDPNSASSTVGRAVDNLQANVGGTIEAVGELVGSDFLTDYGANVRQEQLKEASQYGQPDVTSYTDVHDFDTATEYLKKMGLEAAPSLAVTGSSMAAGAAAGSAIGGALGVPGRAAGAIVGGFLGSFGINTGALQNEIKELDPEAKSPLTSILFGTGAGVLDTVGLKYLAQPLVKALGRDIVYHNMVASGVPKVMALEAITGAAKATAQGAAVEGITEGATEAVQGTLAAKVTDTPLNGQDLWERVVNSAIGGGIVGGGVRGGGHILNDIVKNTRAANTGIQPNTAPGNTSEGGLLSKIWNLGGAAATRPLEGLANGSPEAKSFIEEFRPDMTGKTASGKTAFEESDIMAGTWNRKLTELVEGKSNTEVAALFDAASAPKASLKGDALKFRNFMDEIPKVAETKGGISNIGYIDGFMPFRVDPKKVQSAPEQFIAEISPYVQDPRAALDNWVAEINTPRGSTVPEIDQLVQPNMDLGTLEIMSRQRRDGDPDTMRSKFAKGDAIPKFGHLEFSRAFNSVPQSVLNKWTVEQSPKERTEAVRDYLEGAAHRIAFSERFGVNGEKANARIAKAVYQAQSKGRPVSKNEIDQMYGLLNAYNGMYGRIKSEAAKNATSVFSSFLAVKTLPLATLSSLVEFTTPAIRGDIRHALTSFIPALGEIARDASRTLLRGVPKSDFSKVASDAGLSFQSSLSVAAERLGATVFNRGAAKATRLFFLANGLSVMTHINRTFAAKTADNIFKDNIYQLAAGLDVTSAKGTQLINQLKSMGVDVRSNADARSLYSPSTPSEMAAAREARVMAIHRFTRQAVLEPNIADTPLWMARGDLHLLAMLKRYPSAFSNTILPQLVRKMSPTYQGSYTGAAAGAIGATFILGAMLGIGYIQDELKQIAKNGTSDYQDNRTEGQRFMDVYNTTLAPMQIQYLSDMIFANRYGASPVESIAGPAAGFLKETSTAVSRTISSFQEDPTSGHVWKYLYNQTPARVFKPGAEAIKEEFDLP